MFSLYPDDTMQQLKLQLVDADESRTVFGFILLSDAKSSLNDLRPLIAEEFGDSRLLVRF